jgi:ABC-2 type transport system permease protein
MYATIVGHETRVLAKTPALVWVLLLLIAAVVFGAWSASNTVARNVAGGNAIGGYEQSLRDQMRADLAKYEEKVKASGGTLEFAAINHAPGEGPPQATNAGAVGSETAAYAVLPPTALAALSIGQSDINLAYVPVSMRNVVDVTKENEIENPVNLKTGGFDVAFVVIFLMPIFILAMSYDLLSSEKERGTLAMVLAHPISLGKFMASKLISRLVVMIAVVLAFGLGAVAATGGDLANADTLVRLALWFAATALYCLFWFALAVWVNARGAGSATNGIILAGSWLLFVVVAPTLVSLLATTLYPAPSRLDFTTAAREAQTKAEFERMRALDQYYYDHLELVPDADQKANDFLTLAMANSAAVEKAVLPLHEEFQRQMNRQEGVVARFQYVSPAIMMQRAMNDIAGTGPGRYAHFMGQVFAFHRTWQEFFTAKFLKREPLTTADYDRIPTFAYVEEPPSRVLGRLAPSLLGLLLVVAGLTAVAFASLRRYRVAG